MTAIVTLSSDIMDGEKEHIEEENKEEEDVEEAAKNEEMENEEADLPDYSRCASLTTSLCSQQSVIELCIES